MSQTVFLAKETPGGVSGLEWAVGGEEGAIEVNSAFAEHLMLITDNDFFIVHSKGKKAEKSEAPVAKKAKPNAETPAVDVEDDLTAALKVASSTSQTPKE